MNISGDKNLYRYLGRKGRHYTKRGSKTNGRGFIKKRIDIDNRPSIVDEKIRFGDLIHTITADNGKEFSFHEEIAKNLNIFIYFAKPYHSWEREANENTNGLIRQYFPKGTDFGDITQEQVMCVQNILNSKPRKRLEYMTPKQKFKQLKNLDYNEVALST